MYSCKHFAAALIGALLVVGSAAPLQAEAPVRKAAEWKVQETLDQRYHEGMDRQLLDVFSPQGAVKCPVVVFIHGGAWLFGDKDFFGLYRAVGEFLARHGVVAVLVNYRLSPAVRHPEHVKDVARAYAWVRQNIAKCGGDPACIFLAGHSAGGHLATLLATDAAYWRDGSLGLKESDRDSLRGVIGVCGVYRIPGSNDPSAMIAKLLRSAQPGAVPRPEPTLPLRRQPFKLFQIVFGDDVKLRAQASPVNHVRKGLPPFLLLNAESDFPLLPEMAQEFARALKAAGNAVVESRIAGSDHNSILFSLDAAKDQTAKAILDFLDRYATRPTPK